LESREKGVARSAPFRAIFSIVLILNLFGLLMILSASSVTSLDEYGNSWYQVGRQALWFIISMGALWFAQRTDYEHYVLHIRKAVVAAWALLVLPLMPIIGISVNGSSRWFGVGFLRIQPSEIAKLVLIVFTADLLTKRANRVHDWQQTLAPIMGVFLSFALLLMLEPNLGTTIIIAAVLLVMMFVGGVAGRPLLALLALLAAAAAFFAYTVPFRFRRLMSYGDPWKDPVSTGYQALQSRIGLANGGLFGLGLGSSRVKWGYLPEADTDFIFAIIGEELGLVGCTIIVGLLLAFGYLGIRVAVRAPDRLGMLLATGITTWIMLQAFVNIGAVVGALPITGVPLPFVSAGGSSLIFTMAGVGVLLSVAKKTS
jgi:cell division protein FtsW